MREEREAGKWQTFQSTLRPLVKLRTQPGSLISAFYEFCNWKSFPTFRISYKSNFVAARDKKKKKPASTRVFSSQGFHGPPAPNSVFSSLIKKFLEREKEGQLSKVMSLDSTWRGRPRDRGREGGCYHLHECLPKHRILMAWSSVWCYREVMEPLAEQLCGKSSAIGGVPSRAIVGPWPLPVALLTSWATRWEAWSGTPTCHAALSQQRPSGIMDGFFHIHRLTKLVHL